MRIPALVAALVFLAPIFSLPAAARAMGMEPPLSVPAQPDAPPAQPVTGAPPVLELSLPQPPPAPPIPPVLPEIPGEDLGRPLDPPTGLPDLTGFVDLPPNAQQVLAHAPPFGGSLPSVAASPITAVPEPTTASLLTLGLLGVAAVRRRR